MYAYSNLLYENDEDYKGFIKRLWKFDWNFDLFKKYLRNYNNLLYENLNKKINIVLIHIIIFVLKYVKDDIMQWNDLSIYTDS